MLQPGQSVHPISLPSLDGSNFQLESLSGKPYLLAFFRFASCPFCNLRLHQLISRMDKLPEDFTIVAVFESPLPDLQRYAQQHQSPFPILADEGGVVHNRYGIERSWWGVLKGMLLRFPSLLYAMFRKGYLPLSVGGRMNIMPADFLVDRSGTIQQAHYGSDEGDHLSFECIQKFAWQQSELENPTVHGTL